MPIRAHCEKCGRNSPLRLLDAKPARYANLPMTWEMVEKACATGEDFTVLQCKDCYGPAWVEGED